MSTTMQLTGSRRMRAKIARRSRQQRHRRLQQGLQMLERRTVLSGLPFFTGVDDPTGDDIYSINRGMSQDGTVVVGYSTDSNGKDAFRWTHVDGIGTKESLGGFVGAVDTVGNAASADGSVIIGNLSLPNEVYSFPSNGAFVWTADTGIVQLPSLDGTPQTSQTFYADHPHGVSGDGGVIVGSSYSESVSGGDGFAKTTVWRRDGDGVYVAEELYNGESGFLDNTGTARGVSGDGTVIVGYARDEEGVNEAFRWTAETGMVSLGSLGDEIGKNFASIAFQSSVDGNVVIGYGDRLETGSNPNGKNPKTVREAIRWTQEPVTGDWIMEGLGDLPGGDDRSSAQSVSGDGSYIGGSSDSDAGSEAFVWDEVNHMRSVQDVLIDEYGLDLTGWQLTGLNDISADGLTWSGGGTNPQGQAEGWVAYLGSTEPNDPPVADAGANQSVQEDDAVTFDGSGSSDPDGDTLSYQWDFGDGQTGTGIAPTHAYSYGDTFTVTLTVNDGNGNQDTDTAIVTVNEVNDEPVITSSPVATGTEGASYTYDVDSVDPDTGDTATYSLDQSPTGMTINSGTGVISWTPQSADVGASNDVTVRVTDGSGAVDTQSFSVSVSAPNNNEIYVADISFDSKRGNKDWRATFEVRDQDNNPILGASITVTFDGIEYQGTTNSAGIYTTPWIRNIGSGSHFAEVTDLMLANYDWNKDLDLVG